TADLTVVNSTQTITFDALSNKTYGDADFTISATASSRLPVSFSASGQCTVSGNTVHLTGAGNCSITASQSGNGTYDAAADITHSFTIARADALIQVIPYNVTYDANPHTATGTAKGVNAESLTGLDLSATAHS